MIVRKGYALPANALWAGTRPAPTNSSHVLHLCNSNIANIGQNCDNIRMALADHLTTKDPGELEQILRQYDYPLFVKTLKAADGLYYFRVHNAQNRVVARSAAFAEKRERDIAYEDFLEYVEIEIHKRRQRRLFF